MIHILENDDILQLFDNQDYIKKVISKINNVCLHNIKEDIYIALPGGISTLSDIMNTIASNKPLLIYNIDGYYATLIDLLHEIEMTDTKQQDVTIATSLQDIEIWLEKYI